MPSVERARTSDRSALLRLQAETDLAGSVRLALVSEPVPERTLVARDMQGTPIAMATETEHEVWVEGERRSVSYLGGLRVASEHRGDPRLVARGFRLLRTSLEERGRDWALTAILSENTPARRLLERGARGFPTYRWLAELETSVLATRGRAARDDEHVERARRVDLPDLEALFERANRARQFAPVSLVSSPGSGLAPGDFLVLREGGEPVACAALWDRSSVQRALVRGYAPGLAALRSLANAFAPLGGWPRLPRVGSTLKSVFLAHLAVRDDEPERFARLLRAALAEARRRGFELLVLGFDHRHPLAPVVSANFARRTLQSRLYAVHWKPGAEYVRGLEDRVAAPEVALL